MHYVYILRSVNFPDKFYVGYTLNVGARLDKHNSGESIYTKEHKPWALIFSCCFADKGKALEFEKYLKSHSGKAFTQKRLIL